MSKRDDVNPLYCSSNKLTAICQFLFWVNFTISLISVIFSSHLQIPFSYIQIIGALLYVTFKCVDDTLLWYNAEMTRRKNSIQTALNVPLSEIETEGYYNNGLTYSLAKYALNTFESNYFSQKIAKKMLIKSCFMALASLIILIITGWLISSSDILLVITQAVFSAYVIEDTIVLAIYTIRMKKLYDEAYSMFVTCGIKEGEHQAWFLAYAVEYESIKAHYKVRISTKLFNKNNDELSKGWDSIHQKVIAHMKTL